MKSLKIVYMGTPDFAVPALQALINSRHRVVCVVTVADKPAGRGLLVHQSPIKQCAIANDIPILQPDKLKSPDFLSALSSYQADLFVVVAFRMLPEVVWNMPALGTINLHGSLLPKYRGAAPINRAIMNGEKETGVTVFQLQQEIDTGQVFVREKINIGPDENASSVHDRMMVIGAEVLHRAVDAIAEGNIQPIDQAQLTNGEVSPEAPKIFKEDCITPLEKTVDVVHNHVRGLSYYPAATTLFEGKQMKIFAGQPNYTGQKENGFSTDGKTYLQLGCANGWYRITELQMEGKKRMPIEEFLRGHRLATV